MQKDTEIEQTLLNVRKAYRLLYNYQSRILDLVDFIGSKYGYSNIFGYPKFSNVSPRDGKLVQGKWAWNWLNMYYYEFHFKSKMNDRGDELTFSVFHLADTGFFEAKKNESNLNQIEIENFEKVENSESHLVLVIGKNMWGGVKENWNELNITVPEDGTGKIESEKGIMVYKHYPISSFGDEYNAIEQLKDFKDFCGVNGIAIEMVGEI